MHLIRSIYFLEVMSWTCAEKGVSWCRAAEQLAEEGNRLERVSWKNGATVILQPSRSRVFSIPPLSLQFYEICKFGG